MFSAAWDTHCNRIFQNCVHLTELYVDVSSANSPQQPLKGSHPLPVDHTGCEPEQSEEEMLLRHKEWVQAEDPMGCEDKQPEGRSPLPSEQEGRTWPCLALWIPVPMHPNSPLTSCFLWHVHMSLIIPILYIPLFAITIWQTIHYIIVAKRSKCLICSKWSLCIYTNNVLGLKYMYWLIYISTYTII